MLRPHSVPVRQQSLGRCHAVLFLCLLVKEQRCRWGTSLFASCRLLSFHAISYGVAFSL